MSEASDAPIDFLTHDEAFAVVRHLGFRVRDAGLLSSALARPRTTIRGEDASADIAEKAAAMFESLVRNHALLDGNKRIGVVLTWAFLLNNGWRLEHTEDDAYDLTMSVAAGELDLTSIRRWFADRLRADR